MNYSTSARVALLLAPCLFLPKLASASLSVTQPTASTIVVAGDDYATQVLGNPWDMTDALDVDAQESQSVINQVFSGGVFSGDSTSNDPYIFPLYMGLPSSINTSRGAEHPIDTAHYRYMTLKLRISGGGTQFVQVFYYPGDSSSAPGYTNFSGLLDNQWGIVTFDMNSTPSSVQWTAVPKVMGLRVDPGVASGVHFDIDWIRLTAPATAAQKTTVTWTDTGSATTYSIIAIDNAGAGTSYTIATGISGTSYQADTSFLAPGSYQIQVKRGDNTAANSATFRINSPPQFTFTQPSVTGDISKDFATTVVGNPWGPFSAADFAVSPVAPTGHFNPVTYPSPTTPPGTSVFYGQPIDLDPQWFFNLGGHVIDTSVYRSLCFDLEVFGIRSFDPNPSLGGSVARVFWGNSGSSLTASQDIPLDDNQSDTVVSHYCIPDLAAVALESPINGGTWSGTKAVFRIDPDEWQPPIGCSTPDTCHDVRLDRVTLSPFASTAAGYTFKWNLTDADASDTHVLKLYLDPDTNPANSNEILIYNASVATGAGQYAWPGSPAVPLGTYNVVAVIDDTRNKVTQYAGGPLVVSDEIFRNGFQ